MTVETDVLQALTTTWQSRSDIAKAIGCWSPSTIRTTLRRLVKEKKAECRYGFILPEIGSFLIPEFRALKE